MRESLSQSIYLASYLDIDPSGSRSISVVVVIVVAAAAVGCHIIIVPV